MLFDFPGKRNVPVLFSQLTVVVVKATCWFGIQIELPISPLSYITRLWPVSFSQVNEIDLRQATHDEAIGVLRLTTQCVRLRVFRHHEAYREEDLWDVFSLELRPCPGEGLGLTTVGKRYCIFNMLINKSLNE